MNSRQRKRDIIKKQRIGVAKRWLPFGAYVRLIRKGLINPPTEIGRIESFRIIISPQPRKTS